MFPSVQHSSTFHSYMQHCLCHTSTVSSTLTTPGCLMVRNFLTAFLAIGRCALFVVISKENMLQLLPSSYWGKVSNLAQSPGLSWSIYTLGSIVKGPNAGVDVYSIAEGIRKWWTFGNCGSHSRFEELHGAENKLSNTGETGSQYWLEIQFGRRICWTSHLALIGALSKALVQAPALGICIWSVHLNPNHHHHLFTLRTSIIKSITNSPLISRLI